MLRFKSACQRVIEIQAPSSGKAAMARLIKAATSAKTENDQLKIIGKLENIAPGERLTAARFIGERGFLVTVVQIDPFFTINLSEPTAPKIAGELSVPGFSTYIHAFGEGHLIYNGQECSTPSVIDF